MHNSGALTGKGTIIAIVILALGAGTAFAGNYGNGARQVWGGARAAAGTTAPQAKAIPGPKVVGYSASFKLNRIDIFDGPCPDGYANQCVSGDCSCNEFAGTGNGSSFGFSSDVEFELSVDLSNQPGDPDGTCFPAFGVIFLDGTKNSEVLDVVGAACSNLDHTGTVTGGFVFDNATSAIFDGAGPGVSGKFVGTTEAFNLKLTGKACKGTAPCFQPSPQP